jgi:hypothetical protein
VSAFAFATVFPACLMHAELAAVLGVGARARWRPLSAGRTLNIVVAALAAASTLAPLVWPRQAFWLVWGLTLWLPELVNLHRGAPSLLRDLSRGRPQRTLQLLAGGLLAGLVWELLNFWARCKWIYTVPGFEGSKLFEMPVLGFLGFPVLALGAFATWSLFEEGREPRVRPGARRMALVVLGVLAVLGCLAVYRAALGRTVRSRRPVLEEITSLDPRSVAALRRRGIATPERLDTAVNERGVDAVAAAAGLPAATVASAVGQATLALHKGMGPSAAELLLDAGVPDVVTLGRQDPDVLIARLRAVAASTDREAPRDSEVRVWVAAARGRTRPRR